jgi:hypothetical protein
MPHIYYTVEAVVCVAVQVCFITLFILQIRSEFKHPEMLGSIHLAAHYGGLVGSVFVLVWSVDPQGALGIYSWRTIAVLKDCYTCSVYFVMMKGLINSVLVINSTHGTKSNFIFWLDRNQNPICIISTCIAWIVCFGVNYVGLRNDWSFYYGLFLLYLACSFGACVGLFVRTYLAFLGIKRAIAPNMPLRELYFHHDSKKMRYTIVIGSTVVCAQAIVAFTDMAFPEQLSREQYTPDPSMPNFCLWQFLDNLGLFLILHLGWIPIGISRNKVPSHQLSSKNSDLKKSGSAEAGTKLQRVSSDQISGTSV